MRYPQTENKTLIYRFKKKSTGTHTNRYRQQADRQVDRSMQRGKPVEAKDGDERKHKSAAYAVTCRRGHTET